MLKQKGTNMQNLKNALQNFVVLLQQQVTAENAHAHMQACLRAASVIEEIADAQYAGDVTDEEHNVLQKAVYAVDELCSKHYSIAVQCAQEAIALI